MSLKTDIAALQSGLKTLNAYRDTINQISKSELRPAKIFLETRDWNDIVGSAQAAYCPHDGVVCSNDCMESCHRQAQGLAEHPPRQGFPVDSVEHFRLKVIRHVLDC